MNSFESKGISVYRFIFVAFIFFSSTLSAQMKGAISTGGSVAFRSTTDQDSGSSYLNVEWGVGYYLSHKIIFDVEPSVRFNFNEKGVTLSSLVLGSLAYRLVDLAPDYQYRDSRYRKRDMGIIAGVFASLGAGLWSDGSTSSTKTTVTYTGPAIVFALGTDSGIGKLTVLRIRAQLIHLYPSGSVFDQPRTIYQVGVGFRVFVKL